MSAQPSPSAPRLPTYEDADLPMIYATVSRTRAAQMQGANRIEEIQVTQESHDANFTALEERLARIEAKLDRLLETEQPG